MLKFKRILVSILCASLVPLICWAGGMDFDHRSPEVASALTFTIYVFAAIFFFPGVWENENI